MASSKLEIVYEIKASVDNFRRSIKTSEDGLKRLTQSLTNTERIIKSALSGKQGRAGSDLSDMFKKAAADADLLREKIAKLKAIPTGKGDKAPLVIGAKNAVVAAARQYADSALAASKLAQVEYRLGQAERMVAAETTKEASAQNAAAGATKNHKNSVDFLNKGLIESTHNLVSARYALYDISTEAARVGAALTGASIIAMKTAADFQRAFVDVQRTLSETSAVSAPELRQSLKDLSIATGTSFADLSRLATLANQFGIAGENIASFTKIVSEFSVVTGVSVETASTGFARISQLLGLTAKDYENLASSVLYAGRNAIATEEEILTLTQQLSATAKQAGMTADETVGLATALSSLGIAPEMARGSILRLFSGFDAAVAHGGKKLDELSKVMNLTSDQLTELWSGDSRNATEFLTRFTASLNATNEAGNSANTVLNALGVTQVRDIQLLQKLAGSQDVLTSSLSDAKKGFQDGTDVSSQFQMVIETLNEKIKQMDAAFKAFMDSTGAVLIPVLSEVVDIAKGLLSFLADNPLAAGLALVTVAVAGLSGAFLILNAALLSFSASQLAAQKALLEVGIGGSVATLGIRAFLAGIRDLIPAQILADRAAKKAAASFTLQGMAAGQATVATRLMSFAMKAIPFVLAISFFNDMSNSIQKTVKNTDELTKEFEDLAKSQQDAMNASPLKGEDIGFGVLSKATAISNKLRDLKLWDFMGSQQAAQDYFKNLDASLTSLVQNGNAEYAAQLFEKIREEAIKTGHSYNEIAAQIPNYIKAAQDAIKISNGEVSAFGNVEDASGSLTDVIKTELNAAFTDGAKAQSDFADAAIQLAQTLKDSDGSMNVWSDSGSKAASAFQDFIDIIASQAPNMKTALQGTAAAISLIEQAGGDATTQVQSLVGEINSLYKDKNNGQLAISTDNIKTIDDVIQAVKNLDNVTEQTRTSILNLLSGGTYSKILSAAFNKLRKDIAAVNQEIKTTKDYANELSSVLSRAFTLRFGKGSAISEFRNAIQDINDGLKSAKDKLDEINSTQNDLQIQRIDIQAQIDYANSIGDTQTASDLMAELAAIDTKIANNAEDAAYYTERFSGSLDLTTQAGRDNRDAMLEVITSTDDYVTSLAEAGASQAEINKAVEDGRIALQNLGTSLGISQTDIDGFSKAFNDMGTIIKKTPKDITIKVTTNAAETALNEFIAYANKQSATVQINADIADIAKLIQEAFDNGRLVALNILKDRATAFKKQRDKYEPGTAQWKMWNQRYSDVQNQISTGAYKDGGPVSGPGTATSDSIPAWLSNGEYVIKASAVKSVGVDFLNAINQQRPVSMPSYGSMSSGGSATQIVYLSASDRELLAAAANRPVTLYTSDRIIADSANRGNRELARRGKN